MNSGVLAVIEPLLVSRIISHKAPFGSKTKAGIVLLLISAFFFTFALAFLVFGVFLHLSNNYSVEEAAIAVGLGTLGIAIVTGLISYIIYKMKMRRIKHAKEDVEALITLGLDIFDREVEAPIRDHPKSSILISGLAGLLVGDRFL